MVKNLEIYNLCVLPFEVAEGVFNLAFRSGYFKLEHLKHFLETFSVQELNLCATDAGHEMFLPTVTDEWLEVISGCKSIKSLSKRKF